MSMREILAAWTGRAAQSCRGLYWEEQQVLGTEHLVWLWRQNQIGGDACLIEVMVPQVNKYINWAVIQVAFWLMTEDVLWM